MYPFTLEKLRGQVAELRPLIYRETLPIQGFKYLERDVPGAHRPELDDADWLPFSVGERWGGYDVTAWFRATVAVPEAWRGGRVYAQFLVGPRDGGRSTAETMLYVNGEPLQAIDIWHEDAWLPPELIAGGRVHLALKAWSGVLGVPERRHFKLARLALVDRPTEELYHHVLAIVESLDQLDPNDLRRARLLTALNRAWLLIDWSQPGSAGFYASAADAGDALEEELGRIAEPTGNRPRVLGVGHAHIDVAWLWRVRHSREKAARTFATALHLMRQYPEYRFMHSTPQLYEFLRHDYPGLYERVRERVAAGQWEITGGMWVEADTNLAGGEALIRQFLHGTRFMREQFGVESKLLWLPDVFGYSAALPQIARGCGIEAFLTSKISWSQFNRFPHDTFRWRGLDGSELLTHFVTAPDRDAPFYTYNGELRPADVKGIWDNYRQKEVNDELLMLYGWGDGGGGPTREMLESARALENLPGMPTVGHEHGEPYFARLRERLRGAELPVWDGELYLEYHRGTYTSQAASKRANRRSELLYHEAEWLAATADVLAGATEYPREALDEGWKLILLNQFHDILPGSSIRQVYEDSMADYERVFAIGQGALDDAASLLARGLDAPRGGLLALNSLSWERGGLVSLPWSPELEGRAVALADGRPARAQPVEEEGERRLLVEVDAVPPLGYRLLPWCEAPSPPTQHPLTVTPTLLESRFWRIALNERGQITSLWDKAAGREVLATGARANVLQSFADKPMAFDAWDIDLYYQERVREVDELEEAVVEEAGPLRGVLRLRWRLRESTITQRLTIYADDPRIDFRGEADWHERQVLLKAAFPLEIRATRATYDIQFGQVERPTHWNTSWDWARFEVCAHRWADLSEGDYGVALLNDCKYGHDARDNVLRLTLIKSAISPDEGADRGRHVFTYSLLPHAGDWRAAGVDRAAAELNLPLRAVPVAPRAGDLPPAFALAEVDAPNVVVETVKAAEDEPGAWVIRLYEARQCRSPRVNLRLGRPARRAELTTMLEREGEPVPVDGDTLTLSFRPYEIKTLKVWFQ
ncbi:MAG TPA: alpha-mannosidase [Chloroflexaceae bacterium]|nr:alpha-mannosidase [Chloroflexaceae bacterium]